MKYDDLGLIVMEQGGFPGNIGDSCAETCRLEVLKTVLHKGNPSLAIEEFVTETGYVRHPSAPEGWREEDFSSDQALPLFFAFEMNDPRYASAMEDRFQSEGYRTGNGDLITPGLFFALMGWRLLLSFTLVVQALIFKLPYRWNDSIKWFEKSSGSSSDYLNWVITYLYCQYHGYHLFSDIAMWMVGVDKCFAEISSYYAPEPNAFVVGYYKAVLNV
jgi:hypothetical protein